MVTAIGALVFTGLSLSATQESQYADRYTKAVDQIGQAGPEKLQVRLGGVFALERLSRDSPRDAPTIVEVLSAFVRSAAKKPRPKKPSEIDTCPIEVVAEDVQAAITVLGRREVADDEGVRVDLSDTCLIGADFTDGNFNEAKFDFANLSSAYFMNAKLNDAQMIGADLKSADLSNTFLIEANLHSADLTEADVSDAIMIRANLQAARLTRADLSGAHIEGVLHDRLTNTEGILINSKTRGKWW